MEMSVLNSRPNKLARQYSACKNQSLYTFAAALYARRPFGTEAVRGRYDAVAFARTALPSLLMEVGIVLRLHFASYSRTRQKAMRKTKTCIHLGDSTVPSLRGYHFALLGSKTFVAYGGQLTGSSAV